MVRGIINALDAITKLRGFRIITMKIEKHVQNGMECPGKNKIVHYDKHVAIYTLISAFACFIFYLMFPIIDGAVICKDSPSYMSMDFSREPFYPMFLLLMKSIFGTEHYTFPVVLLQSILAAYATWRLSKLVYDITDSMKLGMSAIAFQFMVSILNRFVANRGSSYIECIMTEGVCLSLFVLFTVQLFLFLDERKVSNLAGTAVYSFLLIDIRKQMQITVLIMFIMVLVYLLIREHKVRKFLVVICIIPVIILADKFVDCTYNYAVRGVFAEHAGNGTGLLTTLLYSSDKSNDASCFADDSETGNLYLKIMDECDKQKLLYKYANQGFTNLTTHYADHYDAIQYGVIDPVIQDYITDELGITDPVLKPLMFDEICGKMSHALLGRNMGRIFKVFIYNSAKGFINSILRMNSVLNWAALALYVLYIMFMIKIRKKMLAYGDKGRRVLLFAEIVLCGIIINSFVVGAMIFTQPRYMIYSMGAFYTALFMMISV